MNIPTKYTDMAISMHKLSESELTKVLFLLDKYMEVNLLPQLERFYTTLDETVKEHGPIR